MRVQDEPVLAMQDTVFFSYGKHPKTKGLGPIGKSNVPGERGLIMHNALAFTTSGVPLGLLSQCIWVRGEIPEEDYQDKIVRLQCTAIEEKESSKWLIALRETQARTPPDVKVVTVADRESDFFEFLTEAEQIKSSYVIRARCDRQLIPETAKATSAFWRPSQTPPRSVSARSVFPAMANQSPHRHRHGTHRFGDDQTAAAARACEGLRLDGADHGQCHRSKRRAPAGGRRVDQLGVVDESAGQHFQAGEREDRLVRQTLGDRDLAQGAQIRLPGRGLHARAS